MNDGRSKDSHAQIASLLLQHTLGQRLGEGVCVGVVAEDRRLLLSDSLRSHLQYITHDYIWVIRAIGLIVNFLLYLLVSDDVAVDIGGGDVCEGL